MVYKVWKRERKWVCVVVIFHSGRVACSFVEVLYYFLRTVHLLKGELLFRTVCIDDLLEIIVGVVLFFLFSSCFDGDAATVLVL